MQDWSEVRIGEFAEVRGGGTPSREVDEYFGGDVPWLSPRDLSDNVGRFVYRGEENLTQSGLDNSSAHLLPLNTVLFSSRATIGRVALAGNPIATSQGFRSLVCNAEVASPYYVYYAMQHYTPAIETIASGATYKEISGSDLAQVKMHLPPLPVQRKIAAILSAYDDLIENNTRRIAILEGIAQLLYREWFVHFRFPGHQDVQFVESPSRDRIGGTVSVRADKVPKGWEVSLIDQAIDVLGGGTPYTKNPDYWEDPSITWFTPSDLTSSGMMFISDSSRRINDLGLRKSSAKMFPAYSVMMTSRATVGVVAINTVPACTNQGFITCVPNDRLSAYYLYFWILENRDRIVNIASGATYKEINKTTFRGFPIAIPDRLTHKRFLRLVEPIGQAIQNLIERNDILRQSSDLLLPRLVSGELNVEDLAIDVTLLEA